MSLAKRERTINELQDMINAQNDESAKLIEQRERCIAGLLRHERRYHP